ncbi:Ig-like domain repeat protein [Candidatus Bathyarchaeota archaeon]|nr:MAG: Ig-like domain repeat protein [Candidatus Bathyarchaeota archaeon]
MKNINILCVSLLVLLLVPIASSGVDRAARNSVLHLAPLRNPLGHFEGNGPLAPTSWTGDGGRIGNPSFENGLGPWVSTSYNAGNRSSVLVTTPGHTGAKSARITLFSANLSIGSTSSLQYDLSQNQTAFNPSARMIAAVFVENITGTTVQTSSLDRVEVTLLLTTSVGNLRTIHYLFGAGAVPSNTVTDIYIAASGFGTTGTWLVIDRNLANDASTFADNSLINAVKQVSLTSMSQTHGTPNHDAHFRYDDLNSVSHWATGDPLVYDSNLDGTYETSSDTILSCPFPCPMTNGTLLKDDPLIRFVDINGAGTWESSEPIVYDTNNDGIYDYASRYGSEPLIYYVGPQPNRDESLLTPVIEATSALFDSIQLYTASGSTDFVRNGGFETGSITGWYNNASFVASSSTFLSGAYSVGGTVTNGGGEMAQSIDPTPVIDSSTVFKASSDIHTMSGSTSGDFAEIWLSLVDSSTNANPVSVHYYFRTGDGSIPANRTDASYHKAPGFGATSPQWFSLSVPLLMEESYFNGLGLGYTPPYRVNLAVVEIGAGVGSSTTLAYFDQISLLKGGRVGSASSYFYANDGQNSTYLYSANNIPQGSLSFQIPLGQQVLNVTSPSGTSLQPGEYSTSASANALTVTISPSAFFNNPPAGNWNLYATSTNAAASIYAQDPLTLASLSSITNGTVNLVSQTADPTGIPISGAIANITVWNPSGNIAGYWAGTSDAQGLWTATNVVLPPHGNPLGTYTLQATFLSSYPSFFAGVKTTQLPIIPAIVPVTVSLSVSIGSISQGTPVTISGTVVNTGTSTPRPGLTITLSYQQAGNNTWNLIAALTTDSTGRYTYTWTPPQGEYHVHASFAGDSQTPSTQSSTSQIIVGPPSVIPPGVSSLPWIMIAIAASAVAAVAIAALVLVRRRQSPNGQPPTSS